ncbi:hypothetical protein EJB05_01122, partial [Eragrostis curvula]
MSVALFSPLPPMHVMAMTTFLLSIAGRHRRRLSTTSPASSASASSIVWREVTGQHKLTIDGCAPCRTKPWDWHVTSRPFDAAGYTWRITYFPNGNSWVDDYDDGGRRRPTDLLAFRFTLLDRAGNAVPELSRGKEMCIFCGETARRKGFHDFARWADLQASGCILAGAGGEADRFTVQCDITVVREWTEDNVVGGAGATGAARVVVPPPDLHYHLNNLLWKKQGTDVTIHVVDGGKDTTYDAHGWLLAARSPVFEAELLAAAREKPSGRRRIEVRGVDPGVFKAMLHFMYTDALPEPEPESTTTMVEEEEGKQQADTAAVAMAQGLLAAAHRYKLERLKLMCEAALLRRVHVGSAASSLAVAETHGCRALKAACEEFIARPGNLKAVMETEGFQKIKAECPAALIEFALKQLA